MRPRHNRLKWRAGYAVFALFYATWVIYLGLDNFAKVTGEYRQARDLLQPARIEEIARRELAGQCRLELRRETDRLERYRRAGDVSAAGQSTCLDFPAAVLEERQRVVAERLVDEKGRLQRRLVVFSISFAAVFLVLPLVFFYLLLWFLGWIFRNITFINQ